MKCIYLDKIALAAIMLLLTGTACKKSFLEVIPPGKLVAQTTGDYNLALNSNDLLTLISSNAQVTMGDEMAAVDPYFSSESLKTQASFRWDPVLYQPTDDAGEMTTPMKGIYLYNKVINEVPAASGPDAEKLSIEAQARAGRAWTYFLLIQYYGKPYNAATAATDPGYPIVEVADVTRTKFTRASVQEVYDFIIKDLTTAIPNLPTQITFRTRMSKAAAEAILGKVYMFMGRFNDALPLLKTAITDMANQAVPVRLYDYNVEFASGGVFLPVSATNGPASILLPNNFEALYAKQTSISVGNNLLVTAPQTTALFGASDLRLKFFTNTLSFSATTYNIPGVRRRFGFTGLFGLQVSDLYLLSAECKCRTNDLAGAKADVEALRVKRMPAADAPVPSAIAGDQMALLKYILDERIREFAGLGYRWFDMRRLSVDPLFSSNVYTHTLYSSATGAVSATYTLKPERLVLRFPEKIINQNPGMPNNP